MELVWLICQWCIVTVAGSLFIVHAVANWGTIFSTVFHSDPDYSVSFVPPLGLPLGVVFFLLIPAQGYSSFWWLAFLIDPIAIVYVYAVVVTRFVQSDDSDGR